MLTSKSNLELYLCSDPKQKGQAIIRQETHTHTHRSISDWFGWAKNWIWTRIPGHHGNKMWNLACLPGCYLDVWPLFCLPITFWCIISSFLFGWMSWQLHYFVCLLFFRPSVHLSAFICVEELKSFGNENWSWRAEPGGNLLKLHVGSLECFHTITVPSLFPVPSCV